MRGGRLPKLQRQEFIRRELVKVDCRTSMNLERALAGELHVSRRTVRRDLKDVLDGFAEEHREQRPYRQIEIDAALVRYAEKAEAKEDYTSAVRAQSIRARLYGLDGTALHITTDVGPSGEAVAKVRAMSPVKQREHMASLIAAKLAADPALLAEVHQRATALLAPPPVEAEVVTEDPCPAP